MNSWVTTCKLQKKVDDFQLGPIDLTIEPGTMTTLVGKNGSGKSTLLKLIMNLTKPDTGDIILFGEPASSPNKNWKPHVAYLPQITMGAWMFTGEALKDLISSWYPNWDETFFQKTVQLFDVPVHKKYNKLSKGLQKKLDLALTMSSQASLMILDEPTASMDIPSTKILGDLLTDWMDTGERAILMTSHQIEDIRKFSDYLAILHNGKLLGNFEKGALMERFRRYWVKGELPHEPIPGEVFRDHRQLATDNPEATERFFKQQRMEWYDQEAMDLEEIITILMTRKAS